MMILACQFFSPVPHYISLSNEKSTHRTLLCNGLATKNRKNNISGNGKIQCVAAKAKGTAQVQQSDPKVEGQQTKDTASVLALGTINPPNVIYQEDFPDFYFRVTNSEHMRDYKAKFKRMCEKTMIRKRHFLWNEEQLKENPALCDYMSPSFDTRNRLAAMEIPKLGHQAALKAISEWGQPKSMITHLIFSTTTGITIPGADFELAKLLGLSPSIKRYMVYMQACYAAGTALRLAKDIAENNKDARVLVVCCEVTTTFFRGPNVNYPNALVGQALFSDGAAAAVVGAAGESVSRNQIEKPLFELVSTDQTVLPNSEGSIDVSYSEAGLLGYLDKDISEVISNNIENIVIKTFKPIGMVNDWNNLFWMVHPGGRAILDAIEEKLDLNADKLDVSRHILSEYGNMSSPSCIFVMDAMRNMSRKKGKTTTGDGFDWGVLMTMGPGITLETILIRSLPL